MAHDVSGIAIVGIASRFPGASDYQTFWENLLHGINSIVEIPKERWDTSIYMSTSQGADEPPAMMSKWCGLVDGIELFDNRAFNISTREALSMDPQQRILLEEAWHCIEDSGIPIELLKRARTAVFIGAMTNDYLQDLIENNVEADSYSTLGNYDCILANRISHYFGFSGASLTIDTACSSSLTALHLAKASILSGENDYAIVGGVNIHIHPWKYLSFSKARMLSPDGQCKTFDRTANGYVPGDGIGVVLLQSLEAAIRDKSNIYAVIKGTASNHCGGGVSITAPSVKAQRDCIQTAYRDAGLNPGDTTYVEMHGTGTSLGDPIEMEALSSVFHTSSDQRRYCAVGSVKTNIGHLEAAAGIAGIIKICLMMKHKVIPKTLNLAAINPLLNLADSAFYPAETVHKWNSKKEQAPLQAGISSMGFGGTNAHIVLESYVSPDEDKTHRFSSKSGFFPFLISAKNEDSLVNTLHAWKKYLSAFPTDIGFGDVCITATVARSVFSHRFSTFTNSPENLINEIENYLSKIRTTKARNSGYGLDILSLGSDWNDLDEPIAEKFQVSLAQLRESLQVQRILLKKSAVARDFIATYVYLETLFNLTCWPGFVNYRHDDLELDQPHNKARALLSLCISGILSIEVAVQLLLGKSIQFEFSRPKIPLIETNSERICWPIQINKDKMLAYIGRFSVGPTASEYAYLYPSENNIPRQYLTLVEAYAYYVSRAADLKETQHTFIKFIAEWQEVISQYNLDIDELICQSYPHEKLDSRQLILLIIVYSSIRQLESKWNLTDARVVNNQIFNEIISLLLDAVVTKKIIAGVILAPEILDNYEEFSRQINHGQQKIDSRYPILNFSEQLGKKNKSEFIQWLSEGTNDITLSSLVSAAPIFKIGVDKSALEPVKLVYGIDDLVTLWQLGASVSWSNIYPEGSYRRVPVPKYAFTRNAFWFEKSSKNITLLSVETGDAAKLLLNPQVSIIRDHRIGQYHIIPAALYLQAVLDHLKKLEITSAALKNINFIKLGKIDSVSTLQLEEASATIFRLNLDENALAVLQWEEIEGVKSNEIERLSISYNDFNNYNNFSADLYQQFYNAGYFYGPTLQVIKNHSYMDGLHYILLSNVRGKNPGKFTISEAIDGLLQAILACSWMKLPTKREKLLLPAYIKKLECYSAVEMPAIVVIPHDRLLSDNEGLMADARLFSQDGRLLLSAEGIGYKPASFGVVERTIAEKLHQVERTTVPIAVNNHREGGYAPAYLYQHYWQKIAPNLKPIKGPKAKVAITFVQNVITSQWQEAIEAAYLHTDVFSYSDILSKASHEENQEEKALGSILTSYQDRNISAEETLDIYWLLPNVENYFCDGVDDNYQSALKALLSICRVLIKKAGKFSFRLVVVANQSVRMHGEEWIASSQWLGVAGLLTSLRKEKPTARFIYADVGNFFDFSYITQLFSRDQVANNQDNSIYISRESSIYAPALGLIDKVPSNDFKPQSGDVYLITGGHRGIGLKISNYLMGTYGVRVIALGRSQISDAERREMIDSSLQDLFFYEAADITDFSALSAVYKKIKNRHGQIKGVIHSSGLIRDKMFVAKSERDFAEVFNVKVKGLFHLDQLTSTEPLDIFVAFSSVVATWGNIGQSDYALANATMDAYMHWRSASERKGKSLSIRWTLWQSGGMGLEQSIQDAFARSTGVLTDKQGLDAFIRALSSSNCQITVTAHPIVPGILTDRALIQNQTLMPEGVGPDSNLIPLISDISQEDQALDSFADAVYQELCEIFSLKLGGSVESIDDNASFFELGVESIVLKEIMAELEKRYDHLQSTLLFEYSTINELAEFLSKKDRKASAPEIYVQVSDKTLANPEFTDNPSIADNDKSEALMAIPVSTKSYHSYFLRSKSVPIAIIGMSGQFPKAPDLDIYWNNLINGVDCIEEVPKERWNIYDFLYTPEHVGSGMAPHNSTSAKWGGFIEDIDKFDSLYFNIPPTEAEQMDPQQRLFLQCAAHAMEHAGYGRTDSHKNKSFGVFVGAMWNEYSQLASQQGLMLNEYKGPGSIYWAIANRVSYFFNLQGPSLAIDTACSSSLTSIALACQQIAAGECDMAIAGGINLSFHPSKYIYLGQAKFLAKDGRCKSFGKDGSGYVPGEGVGAVILKPLSEAERDGDYIYGVIQGSAMNHGGKAAGFTVPNPDAQAQLVAKAISSAGIESNHIDYVECHGTGTSLGDPIEIQGLAKAFGPDYPAMTCPIGSVKSNIGHLEAAAGIAAVIKVLLSYKNSIIPKSIHCEVKNPNIDFSNSPFRVAEINENWPAREERPRYASISSFGAGGSNAHLVMASYDKPQFSPDERKELQLFVISAEDEERLHAYLELFIQFLETPAGGRIPLSSIAYTMQIGRREMDARCAVIAHDHNELQQQLRKVVAQQTGHGVITGNKEWKKTPREVQNDIEKISAAISVKRKGNMNATPEEWITLATYWVRGASIDWMNLYPSPLRKAGLPAYPFAKERYWLTPEGEALYPATASAMTPVVQSNGLLVKRLHPLIDTNVSTLEEQAFSTTLSREAFYLRDHMVYSKPLFPGAAYLELIFAAATLATRRPVTGIRDVIWAKPIQVETTTDLQVAFSQSTNGQSPELITTATVYTLDSDKQRVQHAIARIDFSEVARPVIMSPEELAISMDGHYRKAELYGLLSRAGFTYGETFQVMEEAWSGNGVALTKLVLPAACVEGTKDYFIHPSLLDGALRTSFVVDGLLGRSDFLLNVPFSLKKITFFKALPPICYAYAKLTSADDRIRKYDINLLDEQGNSLVYLEEFTTRALNEPNSISNIDNAIIANWKWVPRTVSSTEGNLAKNIVVLAASYQEIESISLRMEQRGVIGVIHNPNGFRATTNGKFPSYELDTKNRNDWKLLLERFSQNNVYPDYLINILPLSIESIDYSALDADRLAAAVGHALNNSLVVLVALFQAYHAHSAFNQRKVRVHNFHPIGLVGQPQYEAVGGFARALVSVNHHFKLINVGVADKIEADELAFNILMVTKETLDDVEQRIVGMQRTVRRKFVAEPVQGGPHTVMRHGGVYVITGGLGGLGLGFARYLAKKYSARLVLNGRSALDNNKQQLLDELSVEGAQVLYVPGDITSLDDCKKLFHRAEEHFGEINGVFHAAGVLGNTSLANANIQDFFTPIAPKMHGTLNIDWVSRNHQLDLFVLFSSVSVQLGDFGTGSYATGNKFMDSFAELREQLRSRGLRKGHTLSINWPLWDEGGMSMPASERAAYFNYSGMQSLSNDEGIALFEQLLRFSENVLLVAKGDTEKIARVVGIDQLQAADDSLQTHQYETAALVELSESNRDLKLKTDYFLRELFAKHTGFPLAKINSKTDWAKYGIDSVKIMDMNASLQRDLGSLPGTLFFEYSTIDELSDYFIREHRTALALLMGVDQTQIPIINNAEKAPILPTATVMQNRVAVPGSQSSTAHVLQHERASSTINDIAIIGVAGIYPKAKDLAEFWQNLCNGIDCITEIPAERWSAEELYRKQRIRDKVSIQSKWGGFIADVDKFDPYFFGIAPAEAEQMSPEERLFLQATWHAMENAGYSNRHLQQAKVGVYAGVMWSEYRALDNVGTAPMVMRASVANRVSFALNLNGPSLAVDTMCSSSLTAIHLACESLRNGESQMAFAGGVNLSLHPDKYIQLSRSNFLSSDGRCRSFGEGGDGYVPGEGVGVILLKPLDAALADGDTIQAVIKSSAINHGGRANAYTVPNPNAQRDVIYDALVKSGIPADTLSYLEAHGTGTPLGDPIEIAGLSSAFAKLTDKKQFCALGSAKSLVGHLEAAAGVCALTKVILQLQHRMLPPSLHGKTINKNINFSNTPFVLQTTIAPWVSLTDRNGYVIPRRAGISSFGAGGSNAHLILEEAPERSFLQSTKVIPGYDSVTELIVISAKSNDQLWKRLEDLNAWVEQYIQYAIENKNLLTSHATNIRQLIEQRVSVLSGIAVGELHPNLSLEECGINRFSLLLLVEELGLLKNNGQVDSYQTLGDLYAVAPTVTQKTPGEIPFLYGEFTLRDIAYTLQTGRDAMEFRLAFTVDSLPALAKMLKENLASSSLRKSIAANTAIQIENGTHFGSVDDNQQSFLTFGDGEEDRVYLESILANRNWHKIARLWITGVDVKWETLYTGESKPRKIGLPGYPFLRERFWFSVEPLEQTNRNNNTGTVAALHPFIDKNISTLQQQAYSKHLMATEWFVDDHRIGGRPVLPGAAHLEMVYAAATLASGGGIGGIRDIRWLAPVVVENEAVDLQLRLNVSDMLGFELVANDILYSSGIIEFDIHKSGTALDWQEVRSRCITHYSGSDVYQIYENAGYGYGESFHVTCDIWSNEQEAITHLKVKQQSSSGDFFLHPALLDGVLRSVLSVGNLRDNCAAKSTLVPFSLKAFSIFGSLKNECIVHTRYGGDRFRPEFDITVTSLEGKRILELHNLLVLPSRHSLNIQSELVIAQPLWLERPLALVDSAPPTLVLIGETTAFLNKSLPSTQLIHINFSELFKVVHPNQYYVNPVAWDEYVHLLENLDTSAGYVFLENDDVQDSLDILVGFCRAMLNHPEQNAGRILYIYGHSHVENPRRQMIAGLFRALREINPAFTCSVIGVDSYESASLAKRIIAELDSNDHEVRYLDGKREVRSWVELGMGTESPAPQTSRLIREGGNYVISGGLGGLGMIFAQHLIEHYQANILLLGRSSLEAEKNIAKRQRFEHLASIGGIVDYACIDITNETDVLNAIEQFRKKVGGIHGVFHAAGVLDQIPLVETTSARFRAALDAKLKGSENLDNATLNDPLDLFVLFSSVSSHLGDFGSGSYAVSNRFLDSFSHARQQKMRNGERSGQTLAINWPLWTDGGMSIPKDKEALYYDYAGMNSISITEGFRLFYLALATGSPQVWVSLGNAEKIRRLLAIADVGYTAVAAKEQTVANGDNELLQKIQQYLIELVAEHARIPVHRIKPGAEFHSYGINSIMIVAMNERLKEDLGNISETLFFEFNSIDTLAAYFAEHHAGAFGNTSITASDEKLPITVEVTAPQRFQSRLMPTATQLVNEAKQRDIAIIGLAGRYPQAEDLDSFWDILRNGVDCITEVPAERWNYRDFLDEPRSDGQDIAAGKTNSKWGGFIKGIDMFDPKFFGITPKEATHINPQERLFLETAWHALQDAGYAHHQIKGQSVGVFVGAMWADYHFVDIDSAQPSTLHASIANRVSYVMDIKGPSIGLDSMCSSSLTAIHLACESILAGDCEMAFAGGVNLTVHPGKYILLSRSNFLSTDGRCRSFGKGGEGYVPGEGVGAVLLKPLSKAIADGDHIYGIIKGSAINHVGKTNGYTVPSPVAQSEVIATALKKGDVEPSSIDYIEAHGTGTALGDPIELNGLSRVFAEKPMTKKIIIGSVKSNVGHLEAAAGICALTKVLLQLQHGFVAPSLHAQEENPRLSLADSPFMLAKRLEAWPAKTDAYGKAIPRRAGISSFGASGSNAHLIIEEFLPTQVNGKENNSSISFYLIPLSAKTEQSLKSYVSVLLAYLRRHGDLALNNIAYTLQTTRDHYDCRLLMRVSELAQLINVLDHYTQGIHSENILYNSVLPEIPVERTAIWKELSLAEQKAIIDWLAGNGSSWKTLHDKYTARRISLPGYAFDRKSYWLDHSGQYPLVKSIGAPQIQKLLHPLIHENVSTIAEQKFISRLTTARDFVLAEHRVRDIPALPAAAALEMALTAGKLALPGKEIILKDVIWLNLAVPDSEGHLDLAVSLVHENVYNGSPAISTALRFNLHTANLNEIQTPFIEQGLTKKTENSEIVLISSGLIISDEYRQVPEQLVDIDEVEGRLDLSCDGNSWYKHKHSLGLGYGNRFRTLQQISWSANEAVARLQMQTIDSSRQFKMHPGLLDTAMQTAFALIETCLPQMAGKLILPASLKELHFIRQIPDTCVVHTTWASSAGKGSASSDRLEFNVKILANDGSVCIELKKFGVEISQVSASRATLLNVSIQEIQ